MFNFYTLLLVDYILRSVAFSYDGLILLFLLNFECSLLPTEVSNIHVHVLARTSLFQITHVYNTVEIMRDGSRNNGDWMGIWT